MIFHVLNFCYVTEIVAHERVSSRRHKNCCLDNPTMIINKNVEVIANHLNFTFIVKGMELATWHLTQSKLKLFLLQSQVLSRGVNTLIKNYDNYE